MHPQGKCIFFVNLLCLVDCSLNWTLRYIFNAASIRPYHQFHVSTSLDVPSSEPLSTPSIAPSSRTSTAMSGVGFSTTFYEFLSCPFLSLSFIKPFRKILCIDKCFSKCYSNATLSTLTLCATSNASSCAFLFKSKSASLGAPSRVFSGARNQFYHQVHFQMFRLYSLVYQFMH